MLNSRRLPSFRGRLFAVLLAALAASAPMEVAAGPLTVEYWNIKAGYEKPVVVNDPSFVGFFIPVFGKAYDLCEGKECINFTASHPSGLTGARYQQGLHDGWDIFGWVDKWCGIHWLDSTYIVQAWRDEKMQSLVADTIRLDFYSGGTATHGDYYGHVTPNQAVKDAEGQSPQVPFNKGADLGTIKVSVEYGPHLHFEVQDYATKKSLDPVQFWVQGEVTCDKCPEPALLMMLSAGLLATARRRKARLAG